MLRLAFLLSGMILLGGPAPSRAAEPLPRAQEAVLLTVSGNIDWKPDQLQIVLP